jgi:hypothetical protein
MAESARRDMYRMAASLRSLAWRSTHKWRRRHDPSRVRGNASRPSGGGGGSSHPWGLLLRSLNRTSAARAVLSLLSSSSRQRTAKRTCPPPRLPQHAKPYDLTLVHARAQSHTTSSILQLDRYVRTAHTYIRTMAQKTLLLCAPCKGYMTLGQQ